MNKYAMVAINSKRDINNVEIVRRVLIQYEEYENFIFFNTRFLEKDPYFYSKKSSHQYEFFDDGFILVSTIDKFRAAEPLKVKRPYHYNPEYAKLIKVDEYLLEPILFEAKNDIVAKMKFKARGWLTGEHSID